MGGQTLCQINRQTPAVQKECVPQGPQGACHRATQGLCPGFIGNIGLDEIMPAETQPDCSERQQALICGGGAHLCQTRCGRDRIHQYRQTQTRTQRYPVAHIDRNIILRASGTGANHAAHELHINTAQIGTFAEFGLAQGGHGDHGALRVAVQTQPTVGLSRVAVLAYEFHQFNRRRIVVHVPLRVLDGLAQVCGVRVRWVCLPNGWVRTRVVDPDDKPASGIGQCLRLAAVVGQRCVHTVDEHGGGVVAGQHLLGEALLLRRGFGPS